MTYWSSLEKFTASSEVTANFLCIVLGGELHRILELEDTSKSLGD